MRSNLGNAGFVVQTVRSHDNFAAVLEQPEMVCGQVVRETHHVVASLNNSILPRALVGFRRLLLRANAYRQGTQQNCYEYSPHDANPSNEADGTSLDILAVWAVSRW